jgi:hypothetical protein
MWKTSDDTPPKSGTFATLARVQPASAQLDEELLELVEDPQLCEQIQADLELNELAELTQFAEEVRAVLAPTRRNIELSVQERVQRICNAVLSRAGALPPEAALMDETAQDQLIERKLADYRSNKHAFVKLFSPRIPRVHRRNREP